MKKYILIIFVLALAGAGFYLSVSSKKEQTMQKNENQPAQIPATDSPDQAISPAEEKKTSPLEDKKPSTSKPESPATFSDGSEAEGMANEFGTGLAQGRRQSLVIGEGRDRLAEMQARLRQMEAEVLGEQTGERRKAVESLSLQTLQAPIEARQRRLVTEGGLPAASAFDADAIARKLAEVSAEIVRRRPEVDEAVRRGDSLESYRKTARELDALRGQAQNLSLALRSLAEASRVAAIQTKLAEIRSDKESRLGFAERYVTSDYDQRVEMQRGLVLANEAANRGKGLGDYAPGDASLIVQTLRSLGGARLEGFEGKPFADELLRKFLSESFGGVFKLAPGREEEERNLQRELLKAQQDAIRAQKLVIDSQRTAQQEFLASLERMQQQFFQELGRSLAREAIRPVENDLSAARREQGRLQELQERRQYLRGFGINADAQIRNLGADTSLLEQFSTNVRARENRSVAYGHAYDVAATRIATAMREARRNGEDFGSAPALRRAIGGNEQERLAILDEWTAGLPNSEKADVFRRLRLAMGSSNTLSSLDRNVSEEFRRAEESRPEVANLNREADVLRERLRVAFPGIDVAGLEKEFAASGPQKFFETLAAFKGLKFDELDRKLQDVNESLARLNQRLNEAYRNAGLRRPAETPLGRAAQDATDRVGQIATTGLDWWRRAQDGGQVGDLTRSGVDFVQKLWHGFGGFGFGFASGGIAGLDFGPPRGSDTIPAMLTPGEAVVNAQSTRANRPIIEALNRARGPLYLAGGGIANGVGLGVPFLANNFGPFANVARSKDWLDFWHRLNMDEARPPRLDEIFRGGPQRVRVPEMIGEAPQEILPEALQDRMVERLKVAPRPVIDPELALRGRIDPFGPAGLLLRKLEMGDADDPSGADRTSFARRNQLESLNLLRMRQLNAQSRDPWAAFGLAQADSGAQRNAMERALVSRQAANQQAINADPFARFANSEFKAAYTQNQRFRFRPPLGAYEARRPGLWFGLRGFAQGGLIPEDMAHPGLSGEDRAPILAAPGEFILPRSSVTRLGLPFLESLRKFAQGGLVGGAPATTPPGGTGPGLSPEVVRAFQSAAGAVQDSVKAFQSSVSSLTTAFLGFNSAASELARALASFEGKLTVQGTQRVEIVLNGAEALGRLTPEIARMVQDMVRQQLLQVFRTSLPDVQVNLD
jgi:hypothetical protein